MPHLPDTSIVATGKPSILLGAGSGSKVVVKAVGAFKTTTLSEISGVDLSGLGAGDVLIFNSGTGNFEPGDIDGGTWDP